MKVIAIALVMVLGLISVTAFAGGDSGYVYTGTVKQIEIRARQCEEGTCIYFVLHFDDGYVFAMRDWEWEEVGPFWAGDSVRIYFPTRPEVERLE